MSDSKAISDYLRRYNAWRRGEDERTMDEAGIVPEELGRIIDAAVGVLEQAPDMSHVAMRKIEQMGGTPCGLLVLNEAGGIAAVSDMGRVTWLDGLGEDSHAQGGQGAEPVAYAAFAENGNIQIWCSDPIQAETLRQQYGDRIKPLYAAPQPAEQQPAPDVAGLVEALEDIAGTHHHSASAGEYFAKVARAALAEYRKQGGDANAMD